MVRRILSALEKRFGFLAIENLFNYILGFQALVYIIALGSPRAMTLIETMNLHGEKVLHNLELWRLVTYLFIPPLTDPLFFLVYLYLFQWIGATLEELWGSFNFNVYYFFGAMAIALTSLYFKTEALAGALNNSLFLAFAFIFPEVELSLYFLIPIKIKYLAYLRIFFDALAVFGPSGDSAFRLGVLVSYANFFIFFGIDWLENYLHSRRRTQFEKATTPQDNGLPRCNTCAQSPFENDAVELRYCSKCQPPMQFCLDHLKDHPHVKYVK